MTWGDPHSTNWNIPDDARIVEEGESWRIYYSASRASPLTPHSLSLTPYSSRLTSHSPTSDVLKIL